MYVVANELVPPEVRLCVLDRQSHYRNRAESPHKMTAASAPFDIVHANKTCSRCQNLA
jgi:hypothetical protein